MKLKKFINKVDLNKFPNITLHDEFECYDMDDIVKGSVIKQKILDEYGEYEVIENENPSSLRIGACGTYAIHIKDD